MKKSSLNLSRNLLFLGLKTIVETVVVLNVIILGDFLPTQIELRIFIFVGSFLCTHSDFILKQVLVYQNSHAPINDAQFLTEQTKMKIIICKISADFV